MSSFISPPAIIALLIALTVHEAAHAWMADKLGDRTARYEGRLSLNPIVHLDPLGTIVFIVSMMGGVPFGWAKPVPVDPRMLRNPKRDMALVALAGPASNLILAFLSMILLALTMPEGGGRLSLMTMHTVGTSLAHQFFLQIFSLSVAVNLGLMAFNLLPIAPLDGSKILYPFVPAGHEEDYLTFMRYGMHVLIIILIIDGFLNIPLLHWWFEFVTYPFLQLLNWLFIMVA